jgi:hypothetical protein
MWHLQMGFIFAVESNTKFVPRHTLGCLCKCRFQVAHIADIKGRDWSLSSSYDPPCRLVVYEVVLDMT